MAKTAAAATVTPIRRIADSAGISPAASSGPLVTVPLGALAPHPRNRTDLGDLTELTASIKAQGLFEPLNVITVEAFTAAAERDGDPERPGPGITHVIVMGHRRAAAAEAAGLAEVPVIVRDDLAGADAIAAMIGENVHREALTPLQEAEAFAELARRGWRQRKIAEKTGCSQAHVSKRMTLLRLPGAARDALAAGRLSVADALELHKLTGNGGADVITDNLIGKAVSEIAQGYSPAGVIRQAQAELRRARAAQATREKLERDGIVIVTEQQRQRHGWPRLYGGDTAKHATAGCLAAVIASWSGEPEYLCINPASHPRSRENREAQADAERRETEREARKAAKARDMACQQIAAGPLPTARHLTHLLAATVLTGSGGGFSEALRLAWRWLRDTGAVTLDQDPDHYRARDALATAGGDRAALLRYARAYCLALDELHVRSRGYGAPTWSRRHTAHLIRLTAETGYEPTAWEARQLAHWQACQDAVGTLACPGCGCAASGGEGYGDCSIRWDRDQDKPVHECGYGCGQHRAWRDQVGDTSTGAGPGGDGDN